MIWKSVGFQVSDGKSKNLTRVFPGWFDFALQSFLFLWRFCKEKIGEFVQKTSTIFVATAHQIPLRVAGFEQDSQCGWIRFSLGLMPLSRRLNLRGEGTKYPCLLHRFIWNPHDCCLYQILSAKPALQNHLTSGIRYAWFVVAVLPHELCIFGLIGICHHTPKWFLLLSAVFHILPLDPQVKTKLYMFYPLVN